VVAHEFEPKAEQRFAGAQQRMQRIRRAALVVPGQRHRNDAAEGFRQKRRAAPVRQPVRLAGDQDEGYGVERRQKAGPHEEDGLDLAFARNASMMRPNRIGSAIVIAASTMFAITTRDTRSL
jgi:hypothetical protein